MQNIKKFKFTDHFIIYNPGLLTFEWHFYDKKFWITFRGSLETLGAGAGRGPEERCCLARGSRSRAGSGGAGDAAGTAAAARTRVLPRSALRLCRALQRPQWFYPCHTIEVDEWNITSKMNVNNKHLKKGKWDDTKKEKCFHVFMWIARQICNAGCLDLIWTIGMAVWGGLAEKNGRDASIWGVAIFVKRSSSFWAINDGELLEELLQSYFISFRHKILYCVLINHFLVSETKRISLQNSATLHR